MDMTIYAIDAQNAVDRTVHADRSVTETLDMARRVYAARPAIEGKAYFSGLLAVLGLESFDSATPDIITAARYEIGGMAADCPAPAQATRTDYYLAQSVPMAGVRVFAESHTDRTYRIDHAAELPL